MNSGILSALQKFCIISKQAREAVMTRQRRPEAYKLAPSLFKQKVFINTTYIPPLTSQNC